MDLTPFSISRMCIHEIFERTNDREMRLPQYGDECIQLEHAAEDFLRERLVEVLGGSSDGIFMKVKEDQGDGSTAAKVEGLITRTNSNEDFVRVSGEIALNLAASQEKRKIPGGIVVVIQGTCGSARRPFCAIIKAETHSGFNKKILNGHLTLEFAKELFLTPQQKLYKVGFLLRKTGCEDKGLSERYESIVYDHLLKPSTKEGAAFYFYDKFLGCEIPKGNDILTSEFYNRTISYIDTLSVDSYQKLNLKDALRTYLMVRQTEHISISEFSVDYVVEGSRDAYVSYMTSKRVPGRAIVKDLSLLQDKLARKRIRLSNGLDVSGASEIFNACVSITKDETATSSGDGTPVIITIKGKLEK